MYTFFKTMTNIVSLMSQVMSGSYNILRKVVEEFKYSIGVVAVNPVKVKVH
jgi:hypothetical protein